MNNEMFRKLDKIEADEFRTWARENYVRGNDISALLHPVIRAECELMNTEETTI